MSITWPYGTAIAAPGPSGHGAVAYSAHDERRFVRCIAEIITGSGTRAPG
jgi:hypothetical protein